MKETDKLFFELIRVAIGTADSLSHTPSNKEWKALYDMAKKQSLVGVCFAALRRLGADAYEGFARIGMSEMLYLTWMGMTAKIQQKNQTVDEQCVALQKRLSADGLRSCILKGQGVASLYSEHLLGLRQSGDIDVWVISSRKNILDYVKGISPTNEVTRTHTQLKVFEDTEVELHFRPTYLRCPWRNRVLQAWFKKNSSLDNFECSNGFCVPSDEFNLVFIALHIFRHLLGEGVGLRQLMDYYFVLKHVSDSETRDRAYNVLKSLGLDKFAGALMWMCGKVFSQNLDVQEAMADWMICRPDEKLGKMILEEMEIAGNFGHHDVRKKEDESTWMRFWRSNSTNLKFLPYFPEEVICTPFYRVWQKCWQILNGYKG